MTVEPGRVFSRYGSNLGLSPDAQSEAEPSSRPPWGSLPWEGGS